MFPEQAALAGGEHICGRGCGSKNIAETIDLAAFHVHAAEQGRGDEHLAVAQQLLSLRSRDYVSREENNATRLHPLQQSDKPCGHFRAIEANDEQLSDACFHFEHC